MLARVVAAVCSLLSFGLSSAGAGPVSPSDRRVVVYLRTGPSTKPDDATVSFMKRELETLMETAGYRVEWKVLGDPSGKDDRVITVVELRGSCARSRTHRIRKAGRERSEFGLDGGGAR